MTLETAMLSVVYAECCKEASYAEYHNAERRYAKCRFAKCRFAEFRGAV